ncbi:MAG: chromosomal replication initiator protein DnaA [Deltaproteobacteria bacterium]|nr:chromosomal replication initiator protein DnaA [Deltaproteobacteria bacterium]
MELWKKTLSSLRDAVEPYDYKHWIAPVQVERLDESRRELVLTVPDDTHGRWLEEHFMTEIKKALHALTQSDYAVSFTTAEALPAALAEAVAPAIAPRAPRESALLVAPVASVATAATASPDLIDRYRFGSFVDGPTNQFAMSAARAVADHPGTLYNPLFIFGGVGLGKTHLLHAVGHAVRGKNPSARVSYVTSEQYVNDLIMGIQRNEMNQFRARYRDDCDVLLVDDIQFFAGKDRSQEEFFHMFNTLHSAHKQMVLTCDSLPQSIPLMEDRLKSRLQWGLIADIKPPGFETRVAILRRKAEADGVILPDEVAMVVARYVTQNVRELEGALMRIVAMANMLRRPLDVEITHQALGNIIGKTLERIAPDAVLRAVCVEYKVSAGDIKGPRRHRNITVPRQIAMYLVRELTDESLPQIGAFFGGRDHSTVINSLKRVEAMRDANPEIRVQIDRIRRSLRD